MLTTSSHERMLREWPPTTTSKALDRGRDAFQREAWATAADDLTAAAAESPLDAADLEQLSDRRPPRRPGRRQRRRLEQAHHAVPPRGQPGAGRSVRVLAVDGAGLPWRDGARRRLGRPRSATGRRARPRRPGARLPAAAVGVPGALRRRRTGGGVRHLRAGHRRRRAHRRARPGRTRPARSGPVADHARRRRVRHRAARRGDDRGHRRRGRADRQRAHLLRGHRDLSRHLRPPARPRVDRRAQRLVRGPARAGPLPRAVPGAPLRGDAAVRRLAGRDAGGTARLRAALHPHGAARARPGDVPGRRAAPAARRDRRGRGRLPPGQRVRPPPAARARPAAGQPGPARRGHRCDPQCRRRGDRPAEPGTAARGLRRDHPRRG